MIKVTVQTEDRLKAINNVSQNIVRRFHTEIA